MYNSAIGCSSRDLNTRSAEFAFEHGTHRQPGMFGVGVDGAVRSHASRPSTRRPLPVRVGAENERSLQQSLVDRLQLDPPLLLAGFERAIAV
jgi:hypothetical protein